MTIPQNQGHERRLYARYRVDLGAEVQGMHGRVIQGRVRDICTGGLFLEPDLGQAVDGLPLGEHCHVDIALPDGHGSAGVLVEVRRLTPQGFGLRFVNLLDDAAVRLGHFIGQTAASSTTDEHQSHLGHRAFRLLRALSRERLPRIFDRWIEYLLEALLEYSESAESDAHRSLAGSEVGLLIQAHQSGRLALQIHEAIHESLASGALASDPPDKDRQRIELALLDQDVFENWLVKSELSARLEQELRESLGVLRSQAAQLPGHPLRLIEPEGLLGLLESLLDQAGLSGTIRRIGLRSAGHRIAGELAEFYRPISLGWSRLGLVGAETESQPLRAPRPKEDTPATDPWDRSVPPADPGPESVSPPESTARSQPPAGITPTVTQTAPTPALSIEAPSFPGLQLRELFDSLCAQANQMQDASPPRLASLQRWKRNLSVPEGDLLTLPRTQERVALTDRLVTDILTNQSTPNSLKTVLERIPTHLLSMAVTHPGALLDEQHPLVGVLDYIDRLARLLPNGARDDAEHQQEFEILVEHLVTAEAGDLSTLDALTGQLQDLKARLDRLSRSNQVHWISVCEIRERHRQAREAVRLRINTPLSGRRIHPVLTEILDRGWRTLLETVCLANGPDSPHWRRHWRTLWQLHLDTGGEAPEANRVIEVGNQRVLIEELLDGLGAVGLAPWECTELIERLRHALEQVRSGQIDPELHRPFTPLTPAPDDGPDMVAKAIAAADWNAAIARIDALPIGALVWIQEREGPMALRLVWRGQDGSRLGLTDPLGKRLISLRRSRLVRKLLRERLTIDRPAPEGSVQRAATAALEQMQSRIHEHDLPDPLTGLSNQRQLRGTLVEVLTDPNIRDMPHVLGFLELDRFALVTSHYGFDSSEQILRAVAELLRAQLPEARCLAYLGGGRFGALTAIGDNDEIRALGERLRTALDRLPFTPKAKTDARGFSWSLGFSLLDSRHTALPEHYLSAASLACLTAQRNGGDQVILFRDEDPLICKQLEQLQIWAQAEDAIRSERIRLRFQPIAPLAELDLEHLEHSAHHSEILLSVYDEHHQPLNLGDFIAAAEALNMMRTLDRQVIETTLRWLHAHPELDGPLGSVAINVSGQTIGDTDFVTWVGHRLEHWAIPAERVGFEVTETAAIVDIERAATNLAQLKTLGCSLYLDDFGSGLSSYGYLKRLPVDYVKIDGSFIKDIVSNIHDQAIVRSFNEIAHFMGKQTVAEFVENADIISLLREIGIDHVQGYAIARPGFIDEFFTRH